MTHTLPRLRRAALFVLAAALAACTSGDLLPGPPGPDATSGFASSDGSPCSETSCELAPQCGCEGAACDVDLEAGEEGATACRPVNAPGQTLGNCNTPDQCAPGFGCYDGQCYRYCNDDAPCGELEHCLLRPRYRNQDGDRVPVPGVLVCSKACQPERQTANGCPAVPQFACHLTRETPDDGEPFYRTGCTPAPSSGGGNDASCRRDRDCAVGYECVVFGDDRRCKQLCRVADGRCEVGSCRSFGDARPTIDGIEYGYCGSG